MLFVHPEPRVVSGPGRLPESSGHRPETACGIIEAGFERSLFMWLRSSAEWTAAQQWSGANTWDLDIVPRDANDSPIAAAAIEGHEWYQVSRDEDLLSLKVPRVPGHRPVQIVGPRVFLRSLKRELHDGRRAGRGGFASGGGGGATSRPGRCRARAGRRGSAAARSRCGGSGCDARGCRWAPPGRTRRSRPRPPAAASCRWR
jgi:hypothetical protein